MSPTTWRLLLVSFISLFLELLLIRWLSTEVRLFAHLKNLALIACFAGLGIGYGTRRHIVPPQVTFAGMAALAVFALPESLMGVASLKNLSQYVLFTDLYSWTPQAPAPVMAAGLSALLAVFTVIVFMFIPLGQLLGDIFRTSPRPLTTYTLNVAASLAGIVAFTLLSVVGTPPWVWFLCAFVPLLLVLPRRLGAWATALTALAIMLVVPLSEPDSPYRLLQEWSPYQKLQVWRLEALPAGPGKWSLQGGHERSEGAIMYVLDVNETAMMWLLDMSQAELARRPWLTRPGKIEWYDFPYHIKQAPARVLVIGAGGGNDTAAALRHGSGHVDAVEIDPSIAAVGRRFHPEHPYDDPRTTVHINDARRYLAATEQKYDLIVFAQLDNTDYNAMSNLSNIRMDSYIYTRECFAQAFRLLKPDGIMVVNFGANDFWGRRTVRMLSDATGQLPRSFRNDLQLLFPGQENTYVIDPSGCLDAAVRSDARLSAWVREREAHWTPDLIGPDVCDDWPYWFLPKRQIPSLQMIVTVLIILLSATLLRLLLPSESRGVSGHFFFLGAAFMLLEVHSITRVALLLGATWLPSAAVISAVLVMIVLANLAVARWRPPVTTSYTLLFAALLLQAVPMPGLLDPGSPLALGLTLFVYALPLFFAGLVFGRSFDASTTPDDALRSNLMGAICGGLLESLSYVFGMRALVVLIFGLYALSWVALTPRRGARGTADRPAAAANR